MSNTERRNPKSEGIDTQSTHEILSLMNEEDATVIDAVRKAIPDIARLVNETVKIIKNGGRVFYIGAGTSGRLGILDASEMPPTFGVPPDLFQTIIAGGDIAIRRCIEGAEDDVVAGRNAAIEIADRDIAIGIAASGKTPFVLSCLEEAKRKGARCWLITCNEIETPIVLNTIPITLDGLIKIITGPEVIAGSTRLKAGTTTKLVLNMFSTATMIKLGKVYKGLMVDVTPSNKKLIDRAERIIMEITGCSREDASRYLKLSDNRPRVAVVMKAKGLSKEEAERMLKNSGDSLGEII